MKYLLFPSFTIILLTRGDNMAKAFGYKKKILFYRSLLGAACGEALMEQIMDLASDGRIAEGFALPPDHRRSMPDSCHTEQQKPGRLDPCFTGFNKNNKQEGLIMISFDFYNPTHLLFGIGKLSTLHSQPMRAKKRCC